MTEEFKKGMMLLLEQDFIDGEIRKLKLRKEELNKQFSLQGVVKSFYCLDEVHRGKDDVCQRQCEYCRKKNKQ